MGTHADYHTPGLFGDESSLEHTAAEPVSERLLTNGVTYEPAFLVTRECNDLLARIDDRPWMTDLKRRVQHYGWRYDYSSRGITAEMKAGPLPDFILKIASELKKRRWFASVPDQVIVNEYKPGQGIAPHVDRDCFGPSVATLSLGDCWPMQFIPVDGSAAGAEPEEVLLEVGSILVLRNAARNRWTHGIAKRKTDGHGRSRRPRRRRVSVTFRTVRVNC